MYQTCFTSVLMWMKQKHTSKVQEKQKNTSKVQDKCVKCIESNPSVTTNTFLLSSEILCFSQLGHVQSKEMHGVTSFMRKQSYTVISDKRKVSETVRNIRRKQEGSSLGIRQTAGSLRCRIQCKIVVATCIISGFCHEVDDACALPGYYIAYSGNFLKNYHQDFLKE